MGYNLIKLEHRNRLNDHQKKIFANINQYFFLQLCSILGADLLLRRKFVEMYYSFLN